jgi:hypothetical protein
MTTQQTHTPGPWNRIQFDDEEFEVIVGPAGDERICEMRGNEQAMMENARLIAAAPDLFNALKYMNHMGGDERGGYCICPCKNGSAPDEKHSTGCVDARRAIARVEEGAQ